MKKKNGIIIAICAVVVIIIAVVLITKNNSKPELATYNPDANAAATKSGSNVGENSDGVNFTDIKVLSKYTFNEGDNYTMVLVLENTGKGNAAVAVVAKAIGSAEQVVGTERKSIFMDPGAKSVVSLEFDNEKNEIRDDDYHLTVASATSIQPGITKITETHKINGQKVNVTSKNTANFDLLGVEAYVLFFDGDELVDVESEEVDDKASEVFEKGTTQEQKLETDKQFKSVKVYYTQSQDKPDQEDD